jgi:hypothetical protein
MNAAENFGQREEVPLFRAMAATKGAKTTALDADIREIDVAVDDVGYAIAVAALPQVIGNGKQTGEVIAFGTKKKLSAVDGQLASC